MSNEVAGLGTLFYRWDSVGGAWASIGQIKSISGPSASRDTIDTTTLDTTGGYKTFIAGLRDSGEISLKMSFVRATYEIMKGDFESDTLQVYKIALPDAANTVETFEGLVTAIPLDVPIDDVISADITIKISGKVNLDSAT